MRSSALVLLFAVLFLGCPEPPKPVPHPLPPNAIDSGDYPGPDGVIEVFPDGSKEANASPCGKACANLARVPCKEGSTRAGVSCYRGCLEMASHQKIPTLCWSLAESQAAVRACGGLRCLTP